MAEYYAVLSKAVAGLESSSAEARRAVYDKARNALIGQLKAIDPPLPTAEISRQRLELEEAIRRVERETSSVPAGAPVRVAAPQPSEAHPGGPPRSSPKDVFRRAIQDAERGKGEPVRAATPGRDDADWAGETPPPPVSPARQAAAYAPPPRAPVAEPPLAEGPELAPNYDYDWENRDGKPDSDLPADPYVDVRDRPAKTRGGRRRSGRDDHDEIVERARPSRLPLILLLVLIVAMLGGLGALGWSQRAVLADLLGSFDSSTPQEAPAPVVEAPPVDASGKDTDRLLPGAVPGAPAETVRDVSPQSASGASANDAVSSAAAPQASEPDVDALVAQRATLFEEPVDGATAARGVVAIDAAVTWSFNQDGVAGPEAVANIDVPERGLKLTVSFRQNSDPALPASHIVEIRYALPDTFPGKGIKEIPRIGFKPSADSRSQPLTGGSANVDDRVFWIALSKEANDVTSNIALMRDQGWIDLPLVYETGQRAIITFEKGTPGERVFEKTLAAWSGG